MQHTQCNISDVHMQSVCWCTTHNVSSQMFTHAVCVLVQHTHVSCQIFTCSLCDGAAHTCVMSDVHMQSV